MMIKSFIFFIIIFFGFGINSNGQTQAGITTACVNFNELNNKIRDNVISKSEAVKLFRYQILAIKQAFSISKHSDVTNNTYYFPLQGYNYSAIGGKNGDGFIPNKYNYFDGNKHKGHPAHDIFIHDKNQDCLDDKTLKHVNILSVSSGIVIALQNTWDSTSNLRGGKYLYIYNPNRGQIYYYAHCYNITVAIGDFVQAGQVIATVGRTGLNAFKKRSPTHLHFMLLDIDKNNSIKPVNTYNMLVKGKILNMN